jgi:hypothetical protein
MAPTEGIEPKSSLARRVIRWIFASRQSGRLTVAQWPNVWLWILVFLTAGLHVLHPSGSAGHLTRVLADVALLVWAGDELIRGVNPFRRILGVFVLALTIYNLAT